MAATPIRDPPVPFRILIPGGAVPGRLIKIEGSIPYKAERFDINLQTGSKGEQGNEDVALHFSVRIKEHRIARNSFERGYWQEELSDGRFPLVAGQTFEILLLLENFEYKIAVNGQHFCEFRHRIPLDRVTHLMIDGDVTLTKISWDGGSQSSNDFVNVPPPQYHEAVSKVHPSGEPPGFRQPASAYGPSSPGYGQPAAGFNQPPPGYGQPTPAFGHQGTGYGQPNSGYGQPVPSYGQPVPPNQPTPAVIYNFPSNPSRWQWYQENRKVAMRAFIIIAVLMFSFFIVSAIVMFILFNKHSKPR